MPIIDFHKLYAINNLIWLLVAKLSRHPYKVKPYRLAITLLESLHLQFSRQLPLQ